MHIPDTFSPALRQRFPTRRRAAWLGAKTGFAAACLYLGGFLLLAILYDIMSHGSMDRSWATRTTHLIKLTLIVGIPMGVLPATAIGTMTGFVIAWILQANITVFSDASASLLGVMIASLIAAIVTIFFGRETLAIHRIGWYGFFFGFPSIIYIVLSGWKSLKLYKQIQQSNQP
jgi:hypothetical protein